MPLDTGLRLGPYEILAPLGAGGMGEVYRARDTRLGREVAIKVVPEHLIESPEVRARFEREARTISSLNHPHICTLFDVGREGNTDYLVMELVEGETLASRLRRGALPMTEVLRIGSQIADALDRAHRAGVVHRDLKPDNIMLTRSGAKLMDFGLARVTGLAPGGSGVTVPGLTQSPTVAAALTTEGSLVGTFQYMSPEQLEGREADSRSDLWALGATLYEMASGKRAFEGRSQASLIGSIMSTEPPPLSQVAPLTPPAFEQLVRACLEKDSEQRIQTAHDVKLQLAWMTSGGSQAGAAAPAIPRRRVRERLAWALGVLLALVAGAAAAWWLRPAPVTKEIAFELIAPAGVREIDLPRISPDGRRLAFNAVDSVGTAIWVRPMNSLEAVKIPGTEGATRPFWSPDSRHLAFFSGGKLRKVDVAGGPPQVLCDAPRGADGSWGIGDVILFDGSTLDSIQQVSANGGTPSGAMTLDRARGEGFAAWPQFLPDGRHFLYVAYAGQERRTLRVGQLGSSRSDTLGSVPTRVEYASGHLLYVQDGTLLARPFDAGAHRFTGGPFPVAQNVEFDALGSARFSASGEGTLVFRSGTTGTARRLSWFDRAGRRQGTVGEPGIFASPQLSPDERQLAVAVLDPRQQGAVIWVYELARNIGIPLTSGGGNPDSPTWSPDGRSIAYSVVTAGTTDIFVRAANGMGEARRLWRFPYGEFFPESWSPANETISLIGRSDSTQGRWDLYMLDTKEPVRSRRQTETSWSEFGSQFTRDGRLLAYVSRESDANEVYVISLAGDGGKWRVSVRGGSEPQWRADGRELYYLTPDRKLAAVEVGRNGPVPSFSLPRMLFDVPVITDTNMRNRYVAAGDGQRFLVITPEGTAHVGTTTVLLDWLARHRRR